MTIFYSKDAQFELTKEEYEKAMIVWNNNKRAFISRLNVSLSPLYIWAGEAPENNSRRKTNDGEWCIKKFGQWYSERSPEVKIDLKYYPELEDIQEKKEIPSNYAKRLSNNIYGNSRKKN